LKLSFVKYLIFAIVVLAPTILLWNLDAQFYYDWHNHSWFIGYTGEYIRQHGFPPQVYSADQVVGLPQPIFYGWLFFPLLGGIASITGAAIALRIAIVVGFAVQFWAIYVAGRTLGASVARSTIVGALITWAIYPLTNLYNRAAIPEFFAILALTTAVAFGIAAAVAPTRRARACGWLAVIAGVFAAGTHPPTALVGGAFVALLLIAAALGCAVARKWRRDLAITAGIAALLGVGALSPWLYANIRLRDDLYIVSKWHKLSFFPDRSDNLAGRFMPFPYDGETLRRHGDISTPFAEAQISMPLLLLAAWNLAAVYRRRQSRTNGVDGASAGADGFERLQRWVAVLAFGWFAFATALSLSPSFAALFSVFAPYVQFAARLVGHANIALLLLVLVTQSAAPKTRSTTLVYAIAGVVALGGLAMKLNHAAFVRELAAEPRYAWRGDRSDLVAHGQMDAAKDYAALKSVPQLPADVVDQAVQVNFPVGRNGDAFGQVGVAEVDLAKPAWVATNAVVFPWASVLVDGTQPQRTDMAAIQHRVAYRLPAGHHRFEWVWHPDATWLRLRIVAAFSAALLVLGAGMLCVRARIDFRSQI
jgi:hypothetical protein